MGLSQRKTMAKVGRPKLLQNVMAPKTSNVNFSEGAKSKGILDDYAERKHIDTYSGTIQKTPVNDTDITNKKYVDDTAGGGDVSKVGTPVDNQIGVWTGDGTIEGTTGLTYDGSNLLVSGDVGSTGTRVTKGWFADLESTNAIIGGMIPLTASSGVLLKNYNGSTVASFGAGAADSTNIALGGNIAVTGNISLTGTVDGIDIATDVAANTAKVSFDWDYDYNDLINVPAGGLDWTVSQAPAVIHADNYTDTNTTYVSSDFTHDDLTGVDANEHIDWTNATAAWDNTGTFDLNLTDDTAGAFSILQGETGYMCCDTTNGSEAVRFGCGGANPIAEITATGLEVTGNIAVSGTVDGIDIATDVAANTLKVTNATHSGEVTGSGALTIADNVVDEANLKLDEGPTNDYVLTADSTKSGGMKWAAGGAGSVTSYYSIAGIAFLPDGDADYMSRGIEGTAECLDLMTTGIYVGINLPHGVTVTECILYGSEANETWELKRNTIAGTASSSVMATEDWNVADTTITNATIDNSTYKYWLQTSSISSGDEIYGAKITYTT